MTTYLAGGWYASKAPSGLRTEVLDGAMDVAGVLHRAGVTPDVVQRLALRVRALATLVDPHMKNMNGMGPDERDIISNRLVEETVDYPALSGFVSDCLEHVGTRTELLAFYLHLVHVTRMMQLLSMARFVTKAPAKKSPAKKSPAKKKAKPRKAAAKKKKRR